MMPRQPTTAEALAAACLVCQVQPTEVCCGSRTDAHCAARGIAVHLMREHTPLSFPEIAKAISGRSHSTMIGAAARLKLRLQDNHQVTVGRQRVPLRDLLDRAKVALYVALRSAA